MSYKMVPGFNAPDFGEQSYEQVTLEQLTQWVEVHRKPESGFTGFPETAQPVVWTVHYQYRDLNGAAQTLDAQGVAMWALQNAPREVVDWQDLSDLLEGYLVERIVSYTHFKGAVLTGHFLQPAIEGEEVSLTHDQANDVYPFWKTDFYNEVKVFWNGWHTSGSRDGLKFYEVQSRFQKELYPQFTRMGAYPWPRYMAEALGENEPNDWLNIRVYIHATTTHTRMRESGGWICNTADVESVWCGREIEAAFTLVQDVNGARVVKTPRAKFWLRTQPTNKFEVLGPVSGEPVDKIRFNAPRSHLWEQVFVVSELVTEAQQFASGYRMEHHLDYAEFYNLYRHDEDFKLPKGVAKRKALAAREGANAHDPKWSRYNAYLANPEGYVADLQTQFEQLQPEAQADDERLYQTARTQWERSEFAEFLKKWERIVK